MKLYNQTTSKDKRKELRNNATKSEQILWGRLKGSSFMNLKFRRQHGIDKFILDFYCPEIRLAIEVDGASHNQENSEEKDNKRTEYLNTKDIKVIRYSDHDVISNIEKVLERIEKEILKLKHASL